MKETTKDAIIEALMFAYGKEYWMTENEIEEACLAIRYDEYSLPSICLVINGRTHGDMHIREITGLKL